MANTQNVDGDFRAIRIREGHLVPVADDSAGKKGDIAFDTSYIYICVADNTWKKATLANIE
jgi:hypothetical protein